MSFKDYSANPSANTLLEDGTYIGPNMLRNKVRPAIQQLAADGKELADITVPDGSTSARAGKFLVWGPDGKATAASGTGADAGLRADLATSGASLVVWTPADGLQAKNLETALRLSLPLLPEFFGAVGDGVTDDTVAFQNLGAAITAAGGGTIQLRKGATYRVGRQTFTGVADGAAYRQQDMLRIDNCNGVVIEGNGATIKLNDGLRYGSFDPVTGAAFTPPGGGFTDVNYAATVGHILEINGSRNITVRNLKVDGNQANLVKGGYWGDTGIQRRANGITLSNVSNVSLVNVTCNENGLDGLYVQGNEKGQYGIGWDALSFENVTCEKNGRQGCSVVSGRGINFKNCAFNNTAQGAIASLPMAGVDLEPNGTDWATAISFKGCTFENNKGNGLLADAAFNVRGLTVDDCEFWAGFAATGSGDALWLMATQANAKITNCRIYGCISNSHASVVYTNCSIDGTTNHPIYGDPGRNRTYLIDSAKSRFVRCYIASLSRRTVFSNSGAIFEDCEIKFTGSMADATAVSNVTGASLRGNTRFTEDCFPPPATGYSITRSGTDIIGNVTVSGPYVGWNGVPSGPEPRSGPVRQTDPYFNALNFYSGSSETAKCKISYGTAAPASTSPKGSIQFNTNASANGILAWQCTDPAGAGTYQAVRAIVQQTGWTAGTGTANKGAFAAYAGQTHTASYVQATIQSLDNAVKAASQRIKALEDDLRTAGIIN